MKIKYVHERTSADGTIWYVFNPPKYLKEALDVSFKKFRTAEEALKYSVKVDDDYIDHKRRQNNLFHIQDMTVKGIFAYYMGQDEWLDTAANTKRTFSHAYVECK